MEKRSEDEDVVVAGGRDWTGPDDELSKRSKILFMFDVWDTGEATCDGGDEPPRISARRSALFCEPFTVALRSPAGTFESPMRSMRRSCSDCLTTPDLRFVAFFGFLVASPKTLDSSLICGGGIFSNTPRLI